MASQVPAKKNTAFTLYFTLYKSDGTVIANPGTYTKKISKDGGGIADIAASVTEVDTTYGLCSLVIAQAEMNADAVWIQIKDDTTGCVPFTQVIYTTANLMDDIKTDTAAVKVQTDKMAFTVANQIDANVLKVAGTTQTARDIGLSVLLSSGTGTGQLDFTSGVVKANLAQILGTALTETAGYLTAGFKKFFNVATPVHTVASLDQTGDSYAIVNSGTYGNSAINTKIGTPLDLGNGTATLSGNLSDIDSESDLILGAVQGIGTAGGAAVNKDAATSNYGGGITGVTSGTTKVGTQTNTYTATSALDGTYHVMTQAANLVDIVYQFLTGGGTTPVNVVWTGYGTPNARTVTFQAWDHVGAAWETIGTFVTSGTTNTVKNLNLYSRHRGTSAAELGKVYIRLYTASTQATLVIYSDQIYVSYAVTSNTVGYADGAVWINTVTGVDGYDSYTNGTADRPVQTIACALALAVAVGLKRIRVANGSSITLGASAAGYSFIGREWTLALGGQAITSTYIEGATVSGTSSGANAFFYLCIIGTCTTDTACFCNSIFNGTHTGVASASYVIKDCADGIPGETNPVFVFAASALYGLRNWSGGINLNSMASTNMIVLDGRGKLILDSNCNHGEIRLRGNWDITDNVSGGFAGTFTKTANINTSTPMTITANQSINVAQWGGSNIATPAISGEPVVTLAATQSAYAPAKAGDSMVVSDKTGFALSSTGADLILKSSTFVQAITAAINELATYGLTAINTLLVTTGIKAASIPTSGIANAVWDEAIASHLTAGTTGKSLNSASSAGDPWGTALPGAYGAGTAGKIIGDNINAPIGTIDTVVDSIKTQTDKMAFTVTNQINANALTVTDKAGFSLAATGADLILKSSTFVQAIVAAINEFATYGLTAINTLLVTTGIKAASIPAATLAASQHVIVDSGTVTTLSNLPSAPSDWLTASAVKADAVTKIQNGLATPTNITAGTITTVTNLTNLPAVTTGWLTGAGVHADAVTKIQLGLATPTNITAGTITTVTNLTNAPTNGDFTATMKSSLTSAWADMQTAIDDLEILIAQLGAYTLGAGGPAQTYTLTVNGVPCEDAYVVMSTDSLMANPIHSGRTNALGRIVFYPNLPVGTTVYMWSFKDGVTFNNPDIEVTV